MSFDQLPVELVLDIMKVSPSLSALWSLVNTSARLTAIFQGAALEITKAVIECAVPEQTRVFLYAVIRLQSSQFPPGLDAALHPPTFGDSTGPALATTPEVLRSFLLLAHKIHALAHECIDHYIGTCMTMAPSRLDDPDSKSYANLCRPKGSGCGQPKGRPYQLVDTGPPSWAEEQLVLWSLWRVQYWYDLRAGCAANRLEWSIDEIEALLGMDLPQFYSLGHRMSYRQEQLLTILAYLDKRKPPPPEALYSSGLPCPMTIGRFDWGCSLKPATDQLNGKLRIDFRPESWVFAEIMSRDLDNPALFGSGLRYFRRFGFSLWEDKRMLDWGLLPPRRNMPSADYYHRWTSILNEKERERVWNESHNMSDSD